MTTDPAAIAYVLANPQKYYKPEAARWYLSHLLGHGKILNPACLLRPLNGYCLFTGMVTAEGLSRLSDWLLPVHTLC